MSALATPALGEYIEFLTHYDLNEIVGKDRFRAGLKSSFRRYHALLIWQSNLEKGILWKGEPKKDTDFRLYFSESVSDSCQALFLSCNGLYKPSFLILRSMIENSIRCIGIAQDQKVLALTSVFDLIDIVKDTDLIRNSVTAKKHYNKLREDYRQLCKFVHTADKSHMSLTTVVGTLPRFEKNSFQKFDSIFQRSAVATIAISCLLLNARYKKLHHRHLDSISDVLPAEAKNEIMTA